MRYYRSKKIIKALAIVLIVNKEDEIPATEKYLRLCVNASDPEHAIYELQQKDYIILEKIQPDHMFLKHVQALN